MDEDFVNVTEREKLCYDFPNVFFCDTWQIDTIVVFCLIFACISLGMLIATFFKYKSQPLSMFWLSSGFWFFNMCYAIWRCLTWTMYGSVPTKFFLTFIMSIPSILLQLPALFFTFYLYKCSTFLKCHFSPFLVRIRNTLFIVWGSSIFIFLILSLYVGTGERILDLNYVGLAFSDLFYVPIVLIPCYMNIKIGVGVFNDLSKRCINSSWVLFWAFAVSLVWRFLWRIIAAFSAPYTLARSPHSKPIIYLTDDAIESYDTFQVYLSNVFIYMILMEWVQYLLPMCGILLIDSFLKRQPEDASFMTWDEFN